MDTTATSRLPYAVEVSAVLADVALAEELDDAFDVAVDAVLRVGNTNLPGAKIWGDETARSERDNHIGESGCARVVGFTTRSLYCLNESFGPIFRNLSDPPL